MGRPSNTCQSLVTHPIPCRSKQVSCHLARRRVATRWQGRVGGAPSAQFEKTGGDRHQAFSRLRGASQRHTHRLAHTTTTTTNTAHARAHGCLQTLEQLREFGKGCKNPHQDLLGVLPEVGGPVPQQRQRHDRRLAGTRRRLAAGKGQQWHPTTRICIWVIDKQVYGA